MEADNTPLPESLPESLPETPALAPPAPTGAADPSGGRPSTAADPAAGNACAGTAPAGSAPVAPAVHPDSSERSPIAAHQEPSDGHELLRTEMDRAGMDRAGMDQAGMDQAGMDQAGMDLSDVVGLSVEDERGVRELFTRVMAADPQERMRCSAYGLLRLWALDGGPAAEAAEEAAAQVDMRTFDELDAAGLVPAPPLWVQDQMDAAFRGTLEFLRVLGDADDRGQGQGRGRGRGSSSPDQGDPDR